MFQSDSARHRADRRGVPAPLATLTNLDGDYIKMAVTPIRARHHSFKDITGLRFGRLMVVGEAAGRSATGGYVCWDCVCDCGELTTVQGRSLRAGATQSCGCLHKEKTSEAGKRNATHGLTGTAENRVWKGIIQRCTNPKVTGFENYGGRGIGICARWRESFECFLADMGPRPSPRHSIDRYPDNDGNYEPGNCRWATRTEQARNARSNVRVEIDGISMCFSEACERFGVNEATARDRVARNLPIDRVFGLDEWRRA